MLSSGEYWSSCILTNCHGSPHGEQPSSTSSTVMLLFSSCDHPVLARDVGKCISCTWGSTSRWLECKHPQCTALVLQSMCLMYDSYLWSVSPANILHLCLIHNLCKLQICRLNPSQWFIVCDKGHGNDKGLCRGSTETTLTRHPQHG